MTRGVGVHLVPSRQTLPSFEQFHFPGQFEHLNKQFGELAEKSAPESRQRVVIRVRAGGSSGRRPSRRSPVPACGLRRRRCNSRRSGSITALPGDGPSSRARVLTRQPAQVELINHFDDVARQMVFVQPVVDRGAGSK